MNITAEDKAKQLVVYIPDTRGVTVSRYGRGNLKIGLDGVFTYSRLPGKAHALGIPADSGWSGTCPGATDECQSICYAARPVEEMGAVATMWLRNSMTDEVPPIPAECKLLRLHVSGDFDSVDYIKNWHLRLLNRPDVHAWVYTRSWRVPSLLPALELLRALPNLQMFASMDVSTPELPPAGWRRAWIDGDPRAGEPINIASHTPAAERIHSMQLLRTGDDVKTLICPEETKAVANCEECRYCIDGQRNDVTFLKH